MKKKIHFCRLNLNDSFVVFPTLVIDKETKGITFTIGWLKWGVDIIFKRKQDEF